METTFFSVTQTGATSVDLVGTGPPAPTGYQIVGIAGQPVYFDISTTATFSGPVTVCINYDQTQVVGRESPLKLMHYVGAAFVDITVSVDAVNNVICGETTSLSPFAIVQPTSAVGGIAEPPDIAAPHLDASAIPGIPVLGINLPGLLAQLIGFAILLMALVTVIVGGLYARRRWLR